MHHHRTGRKLDLSGMVLMRCENCKLVFNDRHVACTKCGRLLIFEETSVYANLGKNSITSFVYELASGINIKVKANAKFSLEQGAPYRTKK